MGQHISFGITWIQRIYARNFRCFDLMMETSDVRENRVMMVKNSL